MKKILLFFLMSFMLMESRSQTICDSTFMTCDSLSMDSVFIAHPNNLDWLMFEVSINYSFLYAPSFVICPESDSVQFVDEVMDFTGIFGPSTTGLHYTFQNFNFPNGFQINGKIVLDNSISGNNSCQIPFSITVDGPSGINDFEEEFTSEGGIEIYPNPTGGFASVFVDYQGAWNITVYDFNGQRVLESEVNAPVKTIDTNSWSSGTYIVLAKDQRKRIGSSQLIVQ